MELQDKVDEYESAFHEALSNSKERMLLAESRDFGIKATA